MVNPGTQTPLPYHVSAMSHPRPAECRAGDAALARGAWDDARVAFEHALAERESPEAFEGLGLAAWWLDLAAVVFDSRERAYRLFREVPATRLDKDVPDKEMPELRVVTDVVEIEVTKPVR